MSGEEEETGEARADATCLWRAVSSGVGACPTLYHPRKSSVGKTCLTASGRRAVSVRVCVVEARGGARGRTLFAARVKVGVVKFGCAVVGLVDDEFERVEDLDLAALLSAEEGADDWSGGGGSECRTSRRGREREGKGKGAHRGSKGSQTGGRRESSGHSVGGWQGDGCGGGERTQVSERVSKDERERGLTVRR